MLVAVATLAASQAGLHLALALAVALPIRFVIGWAVDHFTKLRLREWPEYVLVRGSAIAIAIRLGAVALRLCVCFAVPTQVPRLPSAGADVQEFLHAASSL